MASARFHASCGTSLLLLLACVIPGCKSREYNQGGSRELSEEPDLPAKEETAPREEVTQYLLPDCKPFGVVLTPTVAYQTPNGAAGTWTTSNSLISTYQQANGMFPQINFAIRIYMMDHLLRDPYLNMQKMERAELTEAQWKRIAKVMTTLHKAHGVTWSSTSFPVPGTRPVPDERVRGLILGAVRLSLRFAQSAFRIYATATPSEPGSGRPGPNDISLALEEPSGGQANTSPVHGKRCVLTRVVGLMREVFSTPEVRAENEAWKSKITSGLGFDRRAYYDDEIRVRLKPLFEARMETPEEKRAFAAVWENLTY